MRMGGRFSRFGRRAVPVAPAAKTARAYMSRATCSATPGSSVANAPPSGMIGMGLQFLLAGKFDPPPVTAVVAVRPRHACRARDEDAPGNLVPASHWPSSIRRQRDHRPAVQRLKGEIRKSPFEIPPGTAGVPWPDGGSGYGDAAFSGIRTGSDTRYHPGRASLPWLDRPGTAGVPWPDGRTDAPGPCETVTSASARTHQPWQGKPAVA